MRVIVIKIKAKPGDVLVLLLYDLMSYTGWRPREEKYSDLDMQCRAVGIFKELNKDSVVLYGMEMLDEDKSRRVPYRINDVSVLPLGAIQKYKNLGRGLDWPELKGKPSER